MKIFSTLISFIAGTVIAGAQTCLFHTGDSTGYPYRIPAIAKAKNGQLIALSDLRPCGSDIGYGRVDILSRVSADNGQTWSEAKAVLQGSGKGEDAGYGDACLVADRERNELLLVCVSGDVPYWKSTPSHRQRIVATHAKYNKKSGRWEWSPLPPVDLTKQIYEGLFDNTIKGLFMGSGRICQSRQIKVGKYYRLYGALCTHRGNFVIYSDDFGSNWKVLGSATASCAPAGDEPKCEELPDGSVLLSSRHGGGRLFNVFRYTSVSDAKGVWGQVVDSRRAPGGINNASGPCNGEILIVDCHRADGKATALALQSLPAGPGRSNVSIYWKELTAPADYNTPLRFASNWQGVYRVSSTGSAYSTMTQQADGRIAFFYEEEPQYYQMVYKALDIAEITEGRFRN